MVQRTAGRTALLVAASAAAVGVLAAGTIAGTPSSPRSGHVPMSANPTPRSQAALFSCPELGPMFTRHAPPIMHIQEERAKAHALEGRSGPGWSVAFAEPTRLGVMAYVDGDLKAATPVLRAAGASRVWAQDQGPEYPEADREDIVRLALSETLQRPLRDVRRELRGLPHDGQVAVWPAAGAVYVQWKTPLPPRVAALAETYVDGALVVVDETPYSPREIQRGVDRILDAEQKGALDVELSTGGSCGDYSGALIGVTPEAIGDAGALQERLSRIAKVPVHVVPEERIQML